MAAEVELVGKAEPATETSVAAEHIAAEVLKLAADKPDRLVGDNNNPAQLLLAHLDFSLP